ncbi:MAG: four helix bundle protein [Rhodothermales bacterium]|nr:four helix bundle protein [Rhodothermales bacterium]
MGRSIDIDDLTVYQRAISIGAKIWAEVVKWQWEDRKMVGHQVVRSADSIAANLAEGFGRFHFKENRHFCYYARGSLFETLTWISKARDRALISAEKCDELNQDLKALQHLLNRYIASIGK